MFIINANEEQLPAVQGFIALLFQISTNVTKKHKSIKFSTKALHCRVLHVSVFYIFVNQSFIHLLF